MSYVLVPEGGFHIEFEVSLHQCMNDKNGEICGKQKLSIFFIKNSIVIHYNSICLTMKLLSKQAMLPCPHIVQLHYNIDLYLSLPH